MNIYDYIVLNILSSAKFWQRRRADIASALECQPSIVVLIDTFKPLAIANIAI
jgi:hypothetical protein